jgi:hypothetical protein
VTDADLPSPPAAESPPFRDGPPTHDHFQPPRLRILHLLAWMTVAAVLLKFGVVEHEARRSSDERTGAIDPTCQSLGCRAIDSLDDIQEAAIIVGLGVMAISTFRGRSGRLQPGHWLLLAEAPNVAYGFLYYAILLVAMVRGDDFFEGSSWCLRIGSAGEIVASACQVALYFIACRRTRDGRRWRLCFAALAVLALPTMLIQLLCYHPNLLPDSVFLSWVPRVMGLDWIVDAMVLLVALTAIVGGVRARRDWVHWLGLAAVVGRPALDIATEVCARFFVPP